MYDNKRLASGIGVLFTLWAIVGLLVVSSGVGVAATVPLSSSGGFNVTANYLSAERTTSVPDTAETTGRPVARFEITESFGEYVTIEKTLDVADVPGLNGKMRILIQAEEAELEGVVFKTDHLEAGTAIWRGFVLDERQGTRFDEFLSYAGPNPNSVTSTDDPMRIEGSTAGDTRRSGEPGFQLYNARIEMSKLTADKVDLSGLDLRVQYDPDDDGDYEYGQ